jgi:hypothetical protein
VKKRKYCVSGKTGEEDGRCARMRHWRTRFEREKTLQATILLFPLWNSANYVILFSRFLCKDTTVTKFAVCLLNQWFEAMFFGYFLEPCIEIWRFSYILVKLWLFHFF